MDFLLERVLEPQFYIAREVSTRIHFFSYLFHTSAERDDHLFLLFLFYYPIFSPMPFSIDLFPSFSSIFNSEHRVSRANDGVLQQLAPTLLVPSREDAWHGTYVRDKITRIKSIA